MTEPEDALLISYKKTQFLPAYFYKVFIKKKKAVEAPVKGDKAGAKKVDPKAPPGE